MRLLITRPQPDAGALARELVERGHETIVSPLLETQLNPEAIGPDVSGFDGVIATSRNAIRALACSAAADDLRAKPLYCVGPGTARLAKDAGFTRSIASEGNARDLAAMIAATVAPGQRLLRLSGRLPDQALLVDVRGILEPAGFSLVDVPVYAVRAVERLTGQASAALADGLLDGVVLMSPATARSWTVALDAGDHTTAGRALVHFCLSPAVANALGTLAPCRIVAADKPNRAALLSIIDHSVAQLS